MTWIEVRNDTNRFRDAELLPVENILKIFDWYIFFVIQEVIEISAMQTAPRNPPTRFVRKSRNSKPRDSETPSLFCEAASRPVVEEPENIKSETEAVMFERSKYNRFIGEMIRKEIESHCDSLPCLDQSAYFEAMHLNIREKKK